jgi:hypothetical protein
MLQLISVRKRGAEMVLDLQSGQALRDIRQLSQGPLSLLDSNPLIQHGHLELFVGI